MAEQDYTRAIRLDPAFSPAYENRTLLYVSTGQYKQAVQDVGRTLVLGDTSNSTYYNLKGYSLLQLKQPTLALYAIEKAISLDPACKDTLSHKEQGHKLLRASTVKALRN